MNQSWRYTMMVGANYTIGWENSNDHTLSYKSLNLSKENLTMEPADTSDVKWSLISLIGLILMTAIGNLLVCLAVCWERRLQNMTNYFLMSLAIADFLVAILVMPLGMIVEIYGKS
ncbi:hypothetical protein SNE40_001218 [Patella caerulea]|uniref:G-protein coupled receptors family 1 profile domain-containing protein n=1 Tax=Patella caerulea TaxID=87958 RepID=A0AAN8Q396_PATCE